jgi:type I restriction enzyme M protein
VSAANSGDLTRRIWALCHVLRGDGVGYHEYISELTYLLFLKMADETGTESALPDGYRWRDLASYDGDDLLTYYRDMLTYLGGHAANPIVQEIYAFPTTVFSHQENLRAVVNGLSKLDWHSVTADGMGDIYEGLLARNSQDARSGAGQYFTPRALVDSMVRLMKPKPEEIIQDPSCGTGGFLISAKQFVDRTDPDHPLPPKFEGVEIEKSTYRICQMNSFLHRLESRLILGDALTSDANSLSRADLVLANPPFGNKVGSARTMRSDLPHRTANKQLAFVQHIRLALKEGGRAAVVVPDNVLFEGGVGRAVRRDLMKDCNLHTILRLPNGIFYSQGVNTNVLFFTRRSEKEDNTSKLWVYDMRTSMPRFGKTRPLLAEHFSEFEAFYGEDPHGSDRPNSSRSGRWRSFDRAEIAERDYNLDLVWLTPKDGTESVSEASTQELSNAIIFHLQTAMAEIELLAEALGSGDAES